MKSKKIVLLLLLHLGVLTAAVLYLLVITASGIGCPIRYVTGIPCPGCGMSRAAFALLHLDFAGAFAAHPMVFVIFPYLFYAIHFNTRIFCWARPIWRNVILITGLVLFLAVYFARLALGIIP